MPSQLTAVLRYLRHAARATECAEQSDAGLLQQFAAERSEAAFAALMARYGPLVLAVCRRVLRDAAGPEDAFQATFLVLARKAGSIRKQGSLVAWLHRVALNISRTTRTAAARRQAHERQAALMSPATRADEGEPRDWQPLLHEEVDRLPEKYRLPVILCYFQGLTHGAAARQLDWPVGTVKGRLARARDLLRPRLARRGLALTTAGLAAVLAGSAVPAAVPPALLARTLPAAVSFAAGGPSAGGVASAHAVALAKGALQTMTTKTLMPVVVLLLAAGLAGLGSALGTGVARQGSPQAPTAGARPPAPKERAAELQPGPEVNGLRARVTPVGRKFDVGEAIPVRYVVRNVSNVEQIVWHCGCWANHVVLVRDARRKEPPLTPFGQQRRRAFSPGGERGKNVGVPIPAGGEDAAYEPYDLTQLYDLSKPGRYTVQYVYEEKQGGWEGRLPSNEAAFEVAAAKEDARNVIEKDGIRFEIRIPNRAWTIPKDAPRSFTPVNVGLRITNRTKKPFRFSGFRTLAPEMLGPDGQALERTGGGDGTYARKQADCPLLKPGESLTFSSTAMLLWRSGRLEFGGEGVLWGGFWQFAGLRPGRYRLRLRYANASGEFMLSTGQPPPVLKGVWGGEIATPFVDVFLTPPVEQEKGANGGQDAVKDLKLEATREEARRRLGDVIKQDMANLQGTWHMVGCEEGGKVLAPENVNPNDFLTFSGTTFYFKSGKRGLSGHFTIDPSKSPKWLDQVTPGAKLVFKGIYDFKGDQLRVFLGAPGGERPTEFKTKEGEKTWLRTYERVKAGQAGRTHEVFGVALSADGKHLLAGSGDTTAILWETASARPVQTFAGHANLVFSVAVSGDGKKVVTGSHDKTVVLWDAASGNILQTFAGHGAEVSSVALSADGKLLTGSWDDTAILWDAATGKKLRTFRGHTGIVTSVALSADGKRAVTGSTDKTAVLWDAVTGDRRQTFQGHASCVFSVALAADGKQVVTGSEDRTAILWDAATGTQVRRLEGHTADVQAVALSADGKHVLTGSRDKTAILWDAATGNVLRIFAGHADQVSSVAWSVDGKQVVTGSYDGTAVLWEAATGKKRQTFRGGAK
jgi:RNA polymerase sigma factor (sigma-70 family)